MCCSDHCQRRTQSTSMCTGNWVEALGAPGQSPPTARFSRRKKGWPNGQAAPGGQIFPCDCLVDGAVEQEADSVRRPFDAGDMEAGGQGRDRFRVAAYTIFRCPRPGSMQCAVDDVRVRPEHLHRVDFARVGPGVCVCIGFLAEHPECWPQAPTGWHLDARLHQAVLELKLVQRLQAGRGVFPGYAVGARVVFGAGRDVQIAFAVEFDVCGARGIGL